VVASKCSRNYFIFEQYKTVESFNLHFLHNIPSVHLYFSASDYKDVGNISGSHFVKTFSDLPLHS
jgi:hypothetical protein